MVGRQRRADLAAANETGWKDTVRVDPQHVTRIVTRWAPQELPTGGVRPLTVTLWPDRSVSERVMDRSSPLAPEVYRYQRHDAGLTRSRIARSLALLAERLLSER